MLFFFLFFQYAVHAFEILKSLQLSKKKVCCCCCCCILYIYLFSKKVALASISAFEKSFIFPKPVRHCCFEKLLPKLFLNRDDGKKKYDHILCHSAGYLTIGN